MKKFIVLVASVAICLSLGTVALAASPDSPTADIEIGSGEGGEGNDSDFSNGGNHGGSDTEGSELGDNEGGSGNGSGTGSGNGAGSGNGSGNGVSSPKTSDSLIVPGLATVALGGTVISVVSKKKMDSEK